MAAAVSSSNPPYVHRPLRFNEEHFQLLWDQIIREPSLLCLLRCMSCVGVKKSEKRYIGAMVMPDPHLYGLGMDTV